MEEYLKGLNQKQLEAVLDTQGYVLVFAGAGSGKTRVLTTRIAHLVKKCGVLPENILAITFTNKAADEMRERLFGLIGDVSKMWVSTIHSMCVKILRQSASKLGGDYDGNFSIYSEIDKTNVLKRVISAMNLDCDKYLKNAKFYISNCKNRDISPEMFGTRPDVKDVSIYTDIFTAYEKELKASNAFDFDDLLVKTYHLLENDISSREYYANKFWYVHIDEFQDTNEIQLKIAKLLSSAHNNLFAVGDDDQSIYGWRGAEIHNILDFEQTFAGAKVHKLEQNYRSTKRILQLANAIIAGNSVRKQKTLWTENDEGDKADIKIAEDAAEEAEYTALKIKQYLSTGAKPSDFAVLMRINALSRSFEQEFLKYNIPYKVYGGFKFFERKEIKDLTAYFRVLTNPLDNESLLRIINVPKRGIGDKTVETLLNYAKQYNLSVFDGMVDVDNLPLTSSAKNKVTELRKLITKLTVSAQVMPLTDIFAEVVNKTAFLSQFEEETEENYGKKMNVNEYQNSIQEFAKQNNGATLSDFLNSITLSSDTDEIEDGNYVTVATIHSVKGLEFPAVFVVGLDETVFPVSRAQDSLTEMEEERRLMYVAITRAQKKLFLTRAKRRFLYGSWQNTSQSMFLTELAPLLGYEILKRQSSSYGGYSSYSQRGGYSSGYSGGYGGGYSGGGYSKSSYDRRGGAQNRSKPDYNDYNADYDYSFSSEQKSNSNFSVSGANKFLSSVQKTAPQQKQKDYSGYVAGAKVRHVKFGTGTVISVTGKDKTLTATVAFPGIGIKTLAVAFAPMDLVK